MPRNPIAFFLSSGKLLAAWALVAGACWLVLESLFFCCITNLLPYAARVSFGFGIYPLLQTSKQHTEPRNYIAIFGDSFGFGAGDDFHHTQHKSRPEFNVTHRLYKRMQRDFISFAIPGSSNLCGWIEDPLVSMNYINATRLHHIEKPSEILLYFYEGNDISDTYRDLDARYLANGYSVEKMNDADYFSAFIEEEMLNKNQINLKARNLGISDNLMLFSYLLNAAEERQQRQQLMEYFSKLTPPQAGQTNHAAIRGIDTPMPDSLQAPPIEMNPQAIEQTLSFIQAIAGYVKNLYPNAAISIIYIPSTITSYRVTSQQINIYNPEGQTLFSLESAINTSNRLCSAIRDIAASHGFGFYDTRPGFITRSNEGFLHGPLDWNHLNKAGYDALADEIYGYLSAQNQAHQFRSLASCATL